MHPFPAATVFRLNRLVKVRFAVSVVLDTRQSEQVLLVALGAFAVDAAVLWTGNVNLLYRPSTELFLLLQILMADRERRGERLVQR